MSSTKFHKQMYKASCKEAISNLGHILVKTGRLCIYKAAYGLAVILPAHNKRTKEARARHFAKKVQENTDRHSPMAVAVAINSILIAIGGMVTVKTVQRDNSADITATIGDGFLTKNDAPAPPSGGSEASAQASLNAAANQMLATPALNPDLAIITTTTDNSLSFKVTTPQAYGPSADDMQALQGTTTNGNGNGTSHGTKTGSSNGTETSNNLGQGPYGPGMLKEADLANLKVAYLIGIDQALPDRINKANSRKAKARHHGNKDAYTLGEIEAGPFNGLVFKPNQGLYISELPYKKGVHKSPSGGGDALLYVGKALHSDCDVVYFHSGLQGIYTYEGLTELDRILTEAKKPLVIISSKNLPPIELWEIVNNHGGWIEFKNKRIETKEALQMMINVEARKNDPNNLGSYHVFHMNEVKVAKFMGVVYDINDSRSVNPEEITIPNN